MLARLDLEDAIVTIDAIGCQKEIAAQIVAGRGDYVLALKKNHGKLLADVRLALAGVLENDAATRTVSRRVEVEQGHGRLEARTYFQTAAPDWLHGRADWKGLKTIGAVVRVCERDGVETTDVRYFISSLRRHGERFARAARGHWGIENSLHWSLDMTYRKDDSRVRHRTFAENLAWLRRLALSLVKQHPGKQSQIMKRRMAAWSPDFLRQLLVRTSSSCALALVSVALEGLQLVRASGEPVSHDP